MVILFTYTYTHFNEHDEQGSDTPILKAQIKHSIIDCRTVIEKNDSNWLEKVKDAEVSDPWMQHWKEHMDRYEFLFVYVISPVIFVYDFLVSSVMNKNYKFTSHTVLLRMKNKLNGTKYLEN